MRIMEWFRSKWKQGKALTLEELMDELKLSELRVRQLSGIATTNPYNENLWDRVHEEQCRRGRLINDIRELEEMG